MRSLLRVHINTCYNNYVCNGVCIACVCGGDVSRVENDYFSGGSPAIQ